MSHDSNDLATPAGSRTGRRAPASPIDAVAGVLIARIGDSKTVVVGDQHAHGPSWRASVSGVNDDHLPDNSGEFQVTVGIRGRNSSN